MVGLKLRRNEELTHSDLASKARDLVEAKRERE